MQVIKFSRFRLFTVWLPARQWCVQYRGDLLARHWWTDIGKVRVVAVWRRVR